MIEKAFFDPISDFALILAPCRALKSTNLTIRSSSYKCTEDGCLVGLVDLRARHSAKIRAKNGTSRDSPCCKDATSFKTVERLSVPVIYFDITPWFERDLTCSISCGTCDTF
jgi:hypothetical protein